MILLNFNLIFQVKTGERKEGDFRLARYSIPLGCCLDIIPQAKPLNAVPSALLGIVAKQQRIAHWWLKVWCQKKSNY